MSIMVHFRNDYPAHKSNLHAATRQHMKPIDCNSITYISPFHNSFSASMWRSTIKAESSRRFKNMNRARSIVAERES